MLKINAEWGFIFSDNFTFDEIFYFIICYLKARFDLSSLELIT